MCYALVVQTQTLFFLHDTRSECIRQGRTQKQSNTASTNDRIVWVKAHTRENASAIHYRQDDHTTTTTTTTHVPAAWKAKRHKQNTTRRG